ncbi:MAG: hypothetical protein AAGH15_07325 [Myxococcota bacterium]
MASDRKRRGPRPETVVRRSPGERKRLPPDLEAFARSDETRLRPPPRGPKLRDPRPVALVPGVSNRDARLVFDRRTDALRVILEVRATGDEAAGHAAAEALCEATRLRLWRGRSLTAFGAYVEDVLGMPEDEARSLASSGAARLGVTLEPLSDEAAAVWLRAEAVLLDEDLEEGVRLAVSGEPGKERVRLELDAGRAPELLGLIGRKLGPLADDQGRGPRAAEREGRERRDGPPPRRDGPGPRRDGPRRDVAPPRRPKVQDVGEEP